MYTYHISDFSSVMVKELRSKNRFSCSSCQVKRYLWFVIVTFLAFFDNCKPSMVLASLRRERRMVATFLGGRHNLISPVVSQSVNCSRKKRFNDWKIGITYFPPHCQNQATCFLRCLSDSSNRYDRFRSLLLKSTSSDQLNCEVSNSKVEASSLPLAREVISILAQKNRTWKRLRHIVHLATAHISDEHRTTVIADIGCDHGLLSIALACTGKFRNVIGTDVSQRAVQDGAFTYQTKFNDILSFTNHNSNQQPLTELPNVEFRIGNGLEPLHQNEVNAICIAGMGINSMLKILLRTSSTSKTPSSSVMNHQNKCNHLYLQPTNSRPKNLVFLYTELQKHGWLLENERIEYLSSRWYITSSFRFHKQTNNEQPLLPGQFLSKLPSNSTMKQIYYDYVQYHKSWLHKDRERKGSLSHEDLSWLHHTQSHT